MFRRKEIQRARERATEYATCKDFRQIFTDDMTGLHLLAYLLTADTAKAEQCFVQGLEDSIHGNPVFKQWARAWSKRAIIQSAIKTVKPAPEQAADRAVAYLGENSLVALVMRWTPFERFVFAMSVLEGYSVRDCSSLLSCRDQEVVAVKSQVLQRLANAEARQEKAVFQAGRLSWDGLLAPAQVA